MRVVVTRPAVSAARTAERLASLGHEPVLLPLSRADHRLEAALDALQAPHGALVVTSAEALRALAAAAPRSAIDFDMPLFAVGDATAAAARQAGFQTVHAGNGGGHELAGLVASTLGDHGLPVLYLAGKPRAPAFEDHLRRAGLSLAVAEIYEMLPLAYSPATIAEKIARPPADAVLLYSRENAIRFFDLAAPLADTLAGLKTLCISTRTAEAVPAAHRARLRIAERPDEDALLALL